MKTITYLIITLFSFAVMVSCGSDKDKSGQDETAQDGIIVDTAKFLVDLAALEKRINDNVNSPNEKDLKKAIGSFQDYAAIFPEDPKSPDYLFKAADFAYSVHQVEKSVKLLQRIIDLYPTYNRIEDVKFTRASHLDFELRDTNAAKEAYQSFIKEFPNSELIDDCNSRIKNIRYSAEEMADIFIKHLEEDGNKDLP